MVLHLSVLQGCLLSLNVPMMLFMSGILLTIPRPLCRYVSFTTISEDLRMVCEMVTILLKGKETLFSK